MATICEEMFPRISALSDGELGPTESVGLQAHLASCAQCQGQFDALQQMRDAVCVMPPPLPPDFAASTASRVLQRAAAEPRVHSVWSQWRGAAAACVAMGGVMALSGASAAATLLRGLSSADYLTLPRSAQGELRTWVGLLSWLPVSCLLCLLVLLCGGAALGLPRLRRPQLQLPGALLLVPLVLWTAMLQYASAVFEYNYDLVGAIVTLLSGVWVVSSAALLVATFVVMLRVSVRGLPQAVYLFGAVLVLCGAVEAVGGWLLALPSRGVGPLLSACSLIAVMLTPGGVVGELVIGSAIVGTVGGALLFICSGRGSSLVRRWLAVGAAALTLVGGAHLWHLAAWDQRQSLEVEARRLQHCDAARTAVLLTGSDLQTTFDASMPSALPEVAHRVVSLQGGRFTVWSPWANNLAVLAAASDWDEQGVTTALMQSCLRTPGAWWLGRVAMWHVLQNERYGVRLELPQRRQLESEMVFANGAPLTVGSAFRRNHLPLPDTGHLEGRLMLDGKPLVHVAVRLMGDWLVADPRPSPRDELRVLKGVEKFASDEIKHMRDCLQLSLAEDLWPAYYHCCRTDEQGRFAFDRIGHAGVVAVLLPERLGHVAANRPIGLVNIGNRRLDLGTIRLQRRP